MSDIYLVCMPFMPVQWPSIGIGQLVAAAKNAEMDVKTIYPSLWFANTIGVRMYSFISAILRPYSQPHSLLAEWFFSRAAFEGFERPCDEYLAINFSGNSSFLKAAHAYGYRKDEAYFIQEFEKIRTSAEQLVAETARQIVDDDAKIVGCSTSYMQYSASLALLSTIKTLNPAIITMIGGADCEADKGYITAKNFDWVDFVVSGDGDIVFPDLCQKILKQGRNLPPEEIPYGVYCQEKLSGDYPESANNANIVPEVACVENLDDVPIPDYIEYFQVLKQTNFHRHVDRVLVAETSRGCWKGYESPCNFCALNGKRMRYRAKSPERVLRELDELFTTYGITNFIMSDTMLNKGYFDNLLKELAQKQKPYKFFFETTSLLNEGEVKLLSDAGVVWIQPGIETFHDALIKLLNKGSSAIENIALLKYALEYGVKCTWFMLTRIPGDKDDYYQEMADFLPLLYHFEPPFIVRGIRFDKFSEYHRRAEQFGLFLSPMRNYRYVYPFTQADLASFATFFKHDGTITPAINKKTGLKNLERKIWEWKKHFYKMEGNNRPELTLTETQKQTHIYDSRPCAVSSKFVLSDLEHVVYKACREPVTQKQLYQTFCSQNVSTQEDDHGFKQTIQSLLDKKLIIQIKGCYLALATVKLKREIPVSPVGF